MKESITLYYRKGSSDKIYQAGIEPKGDGFAVHFAYGRRGAALKTGTKTDAPVAFDEAKTIFERLVSAKRAKGYTPREDGAPFRHPGNETLHGGIFCQLPHPVDEIEAQAPLADSAHGLQEKFDGRRLLVRKEGHTVTGFNRRGLVTALPDTLAEALAGEIRGDCLLDGEALGDGYAVFDVLRSDGADVRDRPCSYRLALLAALVPETRPGSVLRRVETVTGGAAKVAALRKLREEGAEGVVFKRLDASYAEGRDAGRGWLKLKFVATASFVVAGRNGTSRSVGLLLFRDGEPVPAGNVTIPANHPVPGKGAVVEVRYLHAFPESGSVYQPVYLGERGDILPEECGTGQLKYKTEPVPA